MSLADVITRFSTEQADGVPAGYVVTRTVHNGYSQGNVVDGTRTTFNIHASIEPLNGRTLMVLPEGTRTEDVRVIDTATELKCEPIPDHISIRGEDYAIWKVDGPLTSFGVSLYTAYAVRQVNP
jgi:hypothetical protein